MRHTEKRTPLLQGGIYLFLQFMFFDITPVLPGNIRKLAGGPLVTKVQSPKPKENRKKLGPGGPFSVSQKNIGSDKIYDDICLFTRGRILLTEY